MHQEQDDPYNRDILNIFVSKKVESIVREYGFIKKFNENGDSKISFFNRKATITIHFCKDSPDFFEVEMKNVLDPINKGLKSSMYSKDLNIYWIIGVINHFNLDIQEKEYNNYENLKFINNNDNSTV